MNSRVRALKEDYLWRARKNLIGFLSIFCLKYYVLLCLILAAKSALFDYFQILLHSYYDLIKSRYIYIHTRVITANSVLSRALFIIRGVTHLTRCFWRRLVGVVIVVVRRRRRRSSNSLRNTRRTRPIAVRACNPLAITRETWSIFATRSSRVR